MHIQSIKAWIYQGHHFSLRSPCLKPLKIPFCSLPNKHIQVQYIKLMIISFDPGNESDLGEFRFLSAPRKSGNNIFYYDSCPVSLSLHYFVIKTCIFVQMNKVTN